MFILQKERNNYGVHPYYHVIENDGKAHGVLLLNSNAMGMCTCFGQQKSRTNYFFIYQPIRCCQHLRLLLKLWVASLISLYLWATARSK